MIIIYSLFTIMTLSVLPHETNLFPCSKHACGLSQGLVTRGHLTVSVVTFVDLSRGINCTKNMGDANSKFTDVFSPPLLSFFSPSLLFSRQTLFSHRHVRCGIPSRGRAFNPAQRFRLQFVVREFHYLPDEKSECSILRSRGRRKLNRIVSKSAPLRFSSTVYDCIGVSALRYCSD